MSNFERIYDLSFEKLQTYYNLVDHIKHANYEQVSFKKNNTGVIVELYHNFNSQVSIYECQFDHRDMLQTIFITRNNNRELAFDREYELMLEKAFYSYENETTVKKKNAI